MIGVNLVDWGIYGLRFVFIRCDKVCNWLFGLVENFWIILIWFILEWFWFNLVLFFIDVILILKNIICFISVLILNLFSWFSD